MYPFQESSTRNKKQQKRKDANLKLKQRKHKMVKIVERSILPTEQKAKIQKNINLVFDERELIRQEIYQIQDQVESSKKEMKDFLKQQNINLIRIKNKQSKKE